jgi:glycosyltransferase involved in cell wall biosynthesis
MTFVGRTPVSFRRIRMLGPVGSEQVADLLRSHDVYVAPSLDDPCSNAVLEALACGLPVAYRRSGGHPELVGDAGLPFDEPGELAPVLAQLASELEERRAAIRVPALAEVCDRYLEVLAG